MTDQTINNAHEHKLVPYLDMLGLDYSPFTDNPDNSNFYTNPDLTQQKNLIHHLLETSNLIILLLGEQGSGKSTLLQQIATHAGTNWVITRIKADSVLTGEGILRALAIANDLPVDCGNTALLLILDEQLASLNNKGKVPVLMIDDAQHVTTDALQFLINCTTGIGEQKGKCHFILSAEPSLEEKFSEIEITTSDDDRFHVSRIVPYTSQQTRSYVLNRLKNAGMGDNKIPLIQEFLETIYNKSNGIPAEINKLSHLALMDLQPPGDPAKIILKEPPILDNKPGKKKRIPMPGFFAGLFVVLGLAAILFLQNQINTLFKSDSTEPPTIANKKPEAVRQDDLLGKLKKPQIILTTEEPSEEKLITGESKNNGRIKSTQDILQTKIPESNDIAAIKPGENTSIKNIDANKISTKKDKDSVIVDSAKQPVSIKQDPTPQAKPTAQQQPVKKAIEKANTVINKPSNVSDKSWILKQNPAHFSLQILGSRNEKILNKFIIDNQISDKAKRYKIQFKGGDWHVLIYGAYKTRDNAINGLKQLPKTIQTNKPWVRPFKEIQSEIRKGTK